ncbi:MAG: helix-turn-helix domain-containing protein [Clostridia bacterium]|nr:helix-turn-helix domain-containing protein [Clostridia bacterium]
MQRTGAVISRLRKERGMTQLQLADALGISYQAVSNWERGQSMPDISKLPELAALFGATIDELLGRRCPVIEQAAAGQLDEHLQTTVVTPEEAAEAAPFLPPEQAEALAAHAIDSVAEDEPIDLSALLPFMSTSQVDALLQKRLATNDYAPLLPFCSDTAINAAVQARVESGESITMFLPFLSTTMLDRIALEKEEQGESCTEYLPFLSRSALMRIFRQRVQQGQSVRMLLPFLPASAIDQLAASFIND